MGKKIAIGCDHGGFEMKNELVDFSENAGKCNILSTFVDVYRILIGLSR